MIKLVKPNEDLLTEEEKLATEKFQKTGEYTELELVDPYVERMPERKQLIHFPSVTSFSDMMCASFWTGTLPVYDLKVACNKLLNKYSSGVRTEEVQQQINQLPSEYQPEFDWVLSQDDFNAQYFAHHAKESFDIMKASRGDGIDLAQMIGSMFNPIDLAMFAAAGAGSKAVLGTFEFIIKEGISSLYPKAGAAAVKFLGLKTVHNVGTVATFEFGQGDLKEKLDIPTEDIGQSALVGSVMALGFGGLGKVLGRFRKEFISNRQNVMRNYQDILTEKPINEKQVIGSIDHAVKQLSWCKPLQFISRYIAGPVYEFLGSESAFVRFIGDSFYKNPVPETYTGMQSSFSVMEEATQAKGLSALVENVIYDYREKFKSSSGKDNATFNLKWFKDILGIGKEVIPASEEEKHIRNASSFFFDECKKIRRKAQEVGLDLADFVDGEGYVPFIFDLDKIYNNPEKWRNILVDLLKKDLKQELINKKGAKLNRKELYGLNKKAEILFQHIDKTIKGFKNTHGCASVQRVANVLYNVMDSPTNPFPEFSNFTASGMKMPSVLKKRILQLKREPLAEFAINDPSTLSKVFFQGVSNEIAIRRLLNRMNKMEGKLTVQEYLSKLKEYEDAVEKLKLMEDDSEFLINKEELASLKAKVEQLELNPPEQPKYMTWDDVVLEHSNRAYKSSRLSQPTKKQTNDFKREMLAIKNCPKMLDGTIYEEINGSQAFGFNRLLTSSFKLMTAINVSKLMMLPFSHIEDLAILAASDENGVCHHIGRMLNGFDKSIKIASKEDFVRYNIAADNILSSISYLTAENAAGKYASWLYKKTAMPWIDAKRKFILAQDAGIDILEEIQGTKQITKSKLTDDMMNRIDKQIKENGVWNHEKDSFDINVGCWTDTEAQISFNAEIERRISRQLVTGESTANPAWAMSNLGKVGSLFMGWTFSLTNNVILPMMAGGHYGQMSRLIGYGYGFALLREVIVSLYNNDPYDLRDPELHKRAFRRVPLPPFCSEILNYAFKGNYNISMRDLSYALVHGGRGAGLMDAYTTVEHICKSIWGDKEFTEADIKKFQATTGILNMWYLKPIIQFSITKPLVEKYGLKKSETNIERYEKEKNK